jgi:hypothetical protein
MYFTKSLLTALAAAALASSVASACDPPKRSGRTTRVTTVTVTKQSCGHSVLEQLIVLQQPVRIRVVQCEDELQQAAQALLDATAARDAAKGLADEALARVEAAACLLKTMCRTVEVNCRVYTEDEVADAVEVLIARYRTAACGLESAEQLLGERSAQLTAVKEKVARWQQKEQALLEQVAALRTEHVAAAAAGQRNAAAAALAGELNSMLSVNTTAAVRITETIAVSPPQPVAAPATAERDRLLEEVDSILESGARN